MNTSLACLEWPRATPPLRVGGIFNYGTVFVENYSRITGNTASDGSGEREDVCPPGPPGPVRPGLYHTKPHNQITEHEE